MDEDHGLRTASMTTLCRRKRGDTLDIDSSETESDSSPEPSVKRLRFGDHRSSSSGSFHGRIKSWECAECAIASAFMETIQTHLKNTEDNQKKAISLLEKLVEKA
jgi:hypothetical protein